MKINEKISNRYLLNSCSKSNIIFYIYRCLRHNICFADCEKCSKFLTRDAPEIVDIFNTVNVAKMSKFCKQSDFVAAKLNYLRSIQSIQHLLHSTDINVKIIHLVRDPRATVRSLFQANPSTIRSPENFRLVDKLHNFLHY